MSIELGDIVAKLRAPRQILSISGQPLRLSTEQREVLTLMCHGMQHKQIAFRLKWRLAKVRDVSASTLHLTGCKTAAQLGAWAQKQDLLSDKSSQPLVIFPNQPGQVSKQNSAA